MSDLEGSAPPPLEAGSPASHRLTPVDFDPFAEPATPVVVAVSEAQQEIWSAAQMGPEALRSY